MFDKIRISMSFKRRAQASKDKKSKSYEVKISEIKEVTDKIFCLQLNIKNGDIGNKDA